MTEGFDRPGMAPKESLPVALPLMPPNHADYPLPRKDQKAARGLSLYETFVAG